MTRQARIELRDLHLPVLNGTYGPNDVVPDAHVLDLTLTISPDLVQVTSDEMTKVFDYDPLIADIAEIAESKTFETQEYGRAQSGTICGTIAQSDSRPISSCGGKWQISVD